MVYVLYNMQVNICGSNKGFCFEMFLVKGDFYLDYLLNVFLIIYSNYELYYDVNGDLLVRQDYNLFFFDEI